MQVYVREGSGGEIGFAEVAVGEGDVSEGGGGEIETDELTVVEVDVLQVSEAELDETAAASLKEDILQARLYSAEAGQVAVEQFEALQGSFGPFTVRQIAGGEAAVEQLHFFEMRATEIDVLKDDLVEADVARILVGKALVLQKVEGIFFQGFERFVIQSWREAAFGEFWSFACAIGFALFAGHGCSFV